MSLQASRALMDPALRAAIGAQCHSVGKEALTFEERIKRLFTKIHTNAVRHKSNFKSMPNYDLDALVT